MTNNPHKHAILMTFFVLIVLYFLQIIDMDIVMCSWGKLCFNRKIYMLHVCLKGDETEYIHVINI